MACQTLEIEKMKMIADVPKFIKPETWRRLVNHKWAMVEIELRLSGMKP